MSYARGEVGAMLAPGLSGFAFGDVSLTGVGPEFMAGIGLMGRW